MKNTINKLSETLRLWKKFAINYWHWGKNLSPEDYEAIKSLQTNANIGRLLVFSLLVICIELVNLYMEIFFSVRIHTRQYVIITSAAFIVVCVLFFCILNRMEKSRPVTRKNYRNFYLAFWLCYVLLTFCFNCYDIIEHGALDNFYFIVFGLATIPLLGVTEAGSLLALALGLQVWFLCGTAAPVYMLNRSLFAVALAFMLGQLLNVFYLFAKISQRELEKASRIDHLTGLLNRSGLDERLDAYLPAATERGATMAVAVLDVDEFKIINDTFGHSQGDKCLQAIAQSLLADIPPEKGLVSRFGGEEFLLVLKDTSVAEAADIFVQVKRHIEAKGIPSGQADCPNLTVSIGYVVTVLTQPIVFDELFKEADMALYRAKGKGRNLVASQGGLLA